MNKIKTLAFISFLLLLINSNALAQQPGSLTGQVYDSLGAVVVGANVIAVDANAKEKSAVTKTDGTFTIAGLAPGKYTVRVVAPKFSLYEQSDVEVAAGERAELTIALTVQAVEENVDVSASEQVDNDPNNNKDATVLTEKDLDALPDDPEELESALQALAGPSSGPNGGQIYIDGFTGGRLPPKEAIREIRINQNPFSAEYDRLGFGRIEILTKPGSDRWRGQAFFNFNDEALNSRNPFALNRAASQTRFYGGNLSGPIVKNKASFFIDINNRELDNGSLVNALILDPNLNVVPFQQEFTVPNRRLSISPRFDYAINDKNTLVARYSFQRFTAENQGIGDLSLPSRAFSTTNTEHEIRLTETAIINAKTINETRFSYEWEKRDQTGDNTIPTISVAAAFTGGGAQIGENFNRQQNWELQNYTTTSFGKNSQHAVKFGVRLRGVKIDDRSESGYGGSFTFINLNNYRNTILGTDRPTQFRLVSGNPLADVSQFDAGLFVTDDWRVRPDLTLSFGLRYEKQNNIGDNNDFAPRFSFAWSPGAGGARQPKTVFRGGVGVFYDRFSENFTLQTNRFDGQQQFEYIVPGTAPILSQVVFTPDGRVLNVPTAAQLAGFAGLNTVRSVADDLQSPYTIQTALGVERQLPYRTTMAVFYIGQRTLHLLRTRNLNAPVCPATGCNGLTPAQLQALRPNPASGNFYSYESSGVLNQQQVIVNFRTQVSPRISLFGNYRLGFAKSDTDGAGSFPAYTYDLTGEYGSSSFDTRHNFFVGGQFTLPYNFRLSPFIVASSGRPFNIISGVDTNGDTLFTERPTFAQLGARCSQLNIRASFCDVGGQDPNAIIPRNYGRGPSFFNVNLNLSKTFGFGGERGGSNAANNQQGGGNQQAGGNRGGGRRGGGGGGGGRGPGGFGGPGGMGGFGGGGTNAPYNLTFGVQVSNLFNTVNLNNPIGNLASSRFGQSTGIAGGFGPFGGGSSSGNRRLELQMRFSW